MRLSQTRMFRSDESLAGHRAQQRLRLAALTAFLAFGLAGCGSSKPVKYYQLTPPATTLASSPAGIDAVILVRLFQTSHLYREDRIVYGTGTQELGLYESNRWAQPPSELLQDALARGLRASGQFSRVTTMRSDAAIDYYLTGHLYSFREITGGNVSARLSFDVDLVDLKRGRSIWRHTYDHDEACTGKGVGDVVAAMDRNVQSSVQEIQNGIVQAISNYHPQPQ